MTKRKPGSPTGLALQRVKHTAPVVVGVVCVVAATALIFKGKGCMGEGPIVPKANDGYCSESEAYPFKLDKNGNPRKDRKGKLIKNPFYSERDCGFADGKCSKTESDNPEDDNFSIDCLRKRCGDPAKKPEIEGDLFTGPDGKVYQYLEVRSIDEIQEILSDPEKAKALPRGNNYFVVPRSIKETCTDTLDPCSPESEGDCFCPNNVDCIGIIVDLVYEDPPPKKVKHCGNGRYERRKGEQCDTGGREVQGRCRKNHVCISCKCVKVPEEPPPTPPPIEIVEEPEPEPVKVTGCDENVTGSRPYINLSGAVSRALTSRSPAIMAKLGRPAQAKVGVSFFVPSSGVPSATSMRLRCYDDTKTSITCKGTPKQIFEITSKNLGGQGINLPNVPTQGCKFRLGVTLKMR